MIVSDKKHQLGSLSQSMETYYLFEWGSLIEIYKTTLNYPHYIQVQPIRKEKR